jgi:hypothetical protein
MAGFADHVAEVFELISCDKCVIKRQKKGEKGKDIVKVMNVIVKGVAEN